MKIAINRTEFSKGLSHILGVVDKKRTTDSILSHVLLKTVGDRAIEIHAADGDLYLICRYQAEILSSGCLALPAKQLYDIVKVSSSSEIVLTRCDNYWADITASGSRFKLLGANPEDFPQQDLEKQSPLELTIQASLFNQMIERTLFCVSNDDTKPHICGIFFEIPSPDALRMVATDGHRLSLAEGKVEASKALPNGVILPRKGMQELKRLISEVIHEHKDNQQPYIHCELDPSFVRFQILGSSLSMNLIEGSFPTYNHIIPKSSTYQIKINKNQLLDALKRVSVLATTKTHAVTFLFNTHLLELTAESPNLGKANESFPIEYSGQPLTLGFNARFMMDFLALVSEQGVRFDVSDDLTPVVLRPLEETHFLSVMMPMR